MFNLGLIAFSFYVVNACSASSVLLPLSVLNAVVAFWGNGVMFNYGRGEEEQIPNTATGAALLTTVVSIGLWVASRF